MTTINMDSATTDVFTDPVELKKLKKFAEEKGMYMRLSRLLANLQVESAKQPRSKIRLQKQTMI